MRTSTYVECVHFRECNSLHQLKHLFVEFTVNFVESVQPVQPDDDSTARLKPMSQKRMRERTASCENFYEKSNSTRLIIPRKIKFRQLFTVIHQINSDYQHIRVVSFYSLIIVFPGMLQPPTASRRKVLARNVLSCTYELKFFLFLSATLRLQLN
jgi:hypothetical protein